MSGITLLIIGGWIALNGVLLFKGMAFLRLQAELVPGASTDDVGRWMRGKGMADDVPEVLRSAVAELRMWRARSRLYLVFVLASIAVMLAMTWFLPGAASPVA